MDPTNATRTAVPAAWPDAAPPAEASWPLFGREAQLAALVEDLVIGCRRTIVLMSEAAIARARDALGAADPAPRAAGQVAV